MSQTPLKVGAAGAFLLTEKNFRKIMGYQDLWTLAGIAFHGGNVMQGQGSGHGQDRAMDTKPQQGRETCSLVDLGSDSNGAKSHVKGRSWDRLASQDLSPSVSQGTIWRYVAVDGRLGYA